MADAPHCAHTTAAAAGGGTAGPAIVGALGEIAGALGDVATGISAAPH
jgi:hypothetical protein